MLDLEKLEREVFHGKIRDAVTQYANEELTEQERIVFFARMQKDHITLKEAGQQIGKSKERARKLQAKATRKIGRKFRNII